MTGLSRTLQGTTDDAFRKIRTIQRQCTNFVGAIHESPAKLKQSNGNAQPVGANCVRPRTDKDVRPYVHIKFMSFCKFH